MTEDLTAISATDRNEVASVVAKMIRARFDFDFPALRELLAPDVRVRSLGERADILPFPERRNGRDAVVEAIASYQSAVETVECEVLETLIDGDRAAVMRRVRLINRGTGQSGFVHMTDWYRIRDGRIVEIIRLNDNGALRRIISSD